MRATSVTRAPACENACASRRPRPRPAPVITTRFPLTSAPPANEAGMSIWRGHRPRIVPISTITRSMFAEAELLEMHRRMLVIRGFEQRVAALYRDGEVPGFVHLSIGQEAAAVGACWPLRPTT